MAIHLYGPFQGAPGFTYQTGIDPNCVGFVVTNQSLYSDLIVSIQSQHPQANTWPAPGSPSNQTDWQYYIPAGHSLLCPVPNRGQFSNPTTTYTLGPGSTGSGQIWYAWVSYFQNVVPAFAGGATDALAPTGWTSTGYNQMVVQSWGPADSPPQMAPAERAVELMGQPRVVALPVSPAYGVAADVTLVLNTWANVGTAVNIQNFPFNLVNTGGGLNGEVTMGLYSFSVGAFFSAVTFQQQKVQFRLVILDHTSAIVSSLFFTQGYSADTTLQEVSLVSTGTNMFTASFQQPQTIVLAVNAGAGPPYSIQPQAITTFTTGGPFPVTVNATYDIAGYFPPTPGSFVGGSGLVSTAYNAYQGFSW